MFRLDKIIFFLTIFPFSWQTCILEFNQCSDGNTTAKYYGTCCYPFVCFMTSYNYGQCQYINSEINCVKREQDCINTSLNCCTGLVCTKVSNSFSSCSPDIKEPTIETCVAEREQCGGYENLLGQTWNGKTNCCAGLVCKVSSNYYSQCIKI